MHIMRIMRIITQKAYIHAEYNVYAFFHARMTCRFPYELYAVLMIQVITCELH